jgi:hypothetical protein
VPGRHGGPGPYHGLLLHQLAIIDESDTPFKHRAAMDVRAARSWRVRAPLLVVWRAVS